MSSAAKNANHKSSKIIKWVLALILLAFSIAFVAKFAGPQLLKLYLKNGKTVDVKIIDRGPFVENRIIDLSYSSAGEIGILTQGVAMVRLTLLKQSASAMSPVYLKQSESLPPA